MAAASTFSISARATGFATLAALVAPNPLIVGVIGAASIAPWLIFGPWLGYVVDRVRKSRVLWVSAAGGLAAAVALAVVFLAAGVHWVTLLVFAAVISCVQMFLDTTVNSYLVDVVPDSDLPRVNGTMSAWQGTMSVIAPAVTGLVVGQSHNGFAIMLVAVFAGVLASTLRLSGKERLAPERVAASRQPKLPGLRLLVTTPGLFGLCGSVSLMNIYTGMFLVMLPLYVLHLPGLTARHVGVVFAVQSVAVLAGVWLASRLIAASERSAAVLLVTSAALKVLAFGLMLVGSSLWLVLVAVAINGVSAGFWNAPSSTAMLRLSAGRYQTHVIASYKMLASLGGPVGAVAGGAIAGLWGLHAPFAVGLGMAVIVCGIVATGLSRFRL